MRTIVVRDHTTLTVWIFVQCTKREPRSVHFLTSVPFYFSSEMGFGLSGRDGIFHSFHVYVRAYSLRIFRA
jgi:hypothetical protein